MTEQSEHINVTGARAKRLTYLSAREAEIESIDLPELGPGLVALKTLFSGISRGTESLVFHGKVPQSEWSRMRCPHMSGDFGFPVSYGYACVCKVTAIGANVSNLQKEDTVFVLHPHQDKIVLPAEFCVQIPATIPVKRAVLAANMETALNAIWDAELSNMKSPTCAVIGAGVLGMLTASALRTLLRLDPVVSDINPDRRVVSDALGFPFSHPDALSNLNPSGFDFVFHTSSSASGIQAAIDNSSFEGTIVEMSWYGDRPISVHLGGAFHVKRLTIRSSQVGTIARSHRSQLTFVDRLQQALKLLDDPNLDTLLEEPIDFETLPNHVEAIFNSDRLCQLIRY